MARYQVQEMKYNAARPFAVIDNGRSWNRCKGHYETREQAARRARDLNKREEA